MIEKLLKRPFAVISLTIILTTMIAGLFANQIVPNNPNEIHISNKYSGLTKEFPLGTDYLGRCMLSRLICGIRPTLFLSLLAMAGTLTMATIIGVTSGYLRGKVDEVIMRICDIVLSFPKLVIILAIVGILGVGIQNVIIATACVNWPWYARIIRSSIIKYNQKNFIIYSKTIGRGSGYIFIRHLIPNILPEIITLATLDMGWVIISISTLSFLGLGVQAPMAEWGAMLCDAKNAMTINPLHMLAPGLAIMTIVLSFNLLGDSLRDILDPKEL